jgi:hypothetical protein
MRRNSLNPWGFLLCTRAAGRSGRMGIGGSSKIARTATVELCPESLFGSSFAGLGKRSLPGFAAAGALFLAMFAAELAFAQKAGRHSENVRSRQPQAPSTASSFGFTGSVVSERQKADHGAARRLVHASDLPIRRGGAIARRDERDMTTVTAPRILTRAPQLDSAQPAPRSPT